MNMLRFAFKYDSKAAAHIMSKIYSDDLRIGNWQKNWQNKFLMGILIIGPSNFFKQRCHVCT